MIGETFTIDGRVHEIIGLLTFAAIAAAVAAIALIASYVPARRAARLDPVTVLEAE